MDHKTAMDILRFDRLEKRARHYRELGHQRGDRARMKRAAVLEQAAHNRAQSIVYEEVAPYSE